MIQFLRSLFCEPDGSPSSKRFVGIFGAMSLNIALILGSLFKFHPQSDVVIAVATVTLGALGITGIEKIFGKK